MILFGVAPTEQPVAPAKKFRWACLGWPFALAAAIIRLFARPYFAWCYIQYEGYFMQPDGLLLGVDFKEPKDPDDFLARLWAGKWIEREKMPITALLESRNIESSSGPLGLYSFVRPVAKANDRMPRVTIAEHPKTFEKILFGYATKIKAEQEESEVTKQARREMAVEAEKERLRGQKK